jgi:hypothetical protein
MHHLVVAYRCEHTDGLAVIAREIKLIREELV